MNWCKKLDREGPWTPKNLSESYFMKTNRFIKGRANDLLVTWFIEHFSSALALHI